MAEHPLYVAFVWHMHQPYYRDLTTGEISLPWVRLHAAKDYLHMAEVLAAHPNVHVTINMVPSLTNQMLAWAGGQEMDRLAQLAQPVGGVLPAWSVEDKRFILNLAYSISWDGIIRHYARYSELLDRRPAALADPDSFSTADYTDLLAWFNLAWIDPNQLERDAGLSALVTRGRGFTPADLAQIHAKQRALAAAVLPLYTQLAARGQLEISTTPYCHPILPLLVDMGSARRATPDLPLPGLPLTATDDAAAQLRMAISAHQEHFGSPPKGLWPAEGAVSPEILPLVSAAGIRWLASDEIILGRSLGRPFERDGSSMITTPRALYQSYRILSGNGLGPAVVFRDHELADRIGFVYRFLPAGQAADDMIYRLLEIRRRLNDSSRPYLVSIILDGENCWEHYEHNGDPFLHGLYNRLTNTAGLKAVTVSEYLALKGPSGTLARLATGSWIGGDLTTWIGDPEHNRAWEAVARARAALVLAQAAAPVGDHRLAAAWQALYTAEGSDWFWWYSHRNSSEQDPLFDRLFRHALAAVYAGLGQGSPAWLAAPIGRERPSPARHRAAGYCSPPLTAAPYPDEEWTLAAVLQPSSASSGTMQRAEGQIERLFVGHNEHNLYLRLELRERLDNCEVAIYLGGSDGPVNQRIRGRQSSTGQDAGGPPLALAWLIQRLPGQSAPFLLRAVGQDQWESVAPIPAAAGEKVLEVSVQLSAVGLATGEEVALLISLAQRGTVVALLPETGMQSFSLEAFDEA